MANDVHRSAARPDASMEDRLAAEYLRLVELTEAKDRFLTAVSHELRTPLTSILTSTELLGVLGELDGAPAELVGIVDRNVMRMMELIDGLSLLARLESGQLTLDLRLVDPAELVAGAVDRHRSGTDRDDLDIEVQVTDGPPATADPQRLGLVLDNLLSNAAKHTPAAGRITVRAEPGGAGWTVTVQDTGIGLPAADFGLGLTISHRLTELHGGRLAVTAAEGTGTTATLELPYAYADPRLNA